MEEIIIAYPGTIEYANVSLFVKGIYERRLQSVTAASPDAFAYLAHEVKIIGCLGLYRGEKRERLFFEHSDPPGAGERLAGTARLDRREIGEIGSRAVEIPEDLGIKSVDVSIALTAAIACIARALGIRHLGFVTNRLVRAVTGPLGFDLVHLGRPDFSGKDPAFQHNLKVFLDGRQSCMGFTIHSIQQCEIVLGRLMAGLPRMPLENPVLYAG